MITPEQIRTLAARYQINETVVAREYIQLAFLQKFYQKRASQSVYFKGGTAIHLLFGAPRFSEDLDFTVNAAPSEFDTHIQGVLDRMQREEGVEWKPKKSISGQQFLLTAQAPGTSQALHIRLDFSFREEVLFPQRSIIRTDYPVIFTSYLYHLSQDELLAEKARAIMTRRKGRDLYDAWYLMSKGATLDYAVIQKKMAYYNISEITPTQILDKVLEFPEKEFVTDLRPFIPQNERASLPEFFRYLKDSLQQALKA